MRSGGIIISQQSLFLEFVLWYNGSKNKGEHKMIEVIIASIMCFIATTIPLFANYTIMQMIVVIITFSIMVFCWCFLGRTLSSLPYLRKFLLKYKQIIVPVVLICLGIYIILKAI